jgi:hypothetical protein
MVAKVLSDRNFDQCFASFPNDFNSTAANPLVPQQKNNIIVNGLGFSGAAIISGDQAGPFTNDHK